MQYTCGGYSLKNYHTHTFRCNHAEGDVLDYVKVAAQRAFKVLGFADHTPLPDNRWLFMRMDKSQLPVYNRAIEEAQEKYSELVILKAMECEWAPEYHNYFAEVLLGEYQFDYLILGSHFFPYRGSWLSSHMDVSIPEHLVAYTEHLIQSMQSGLFSIVAHPDLFGLTYLTWDENTISASKDILAAAEELKIPIEINGYGLIEKFIKTPTGIRNAYPWLEFWKLARDYKVTVVVNSDAHHPNNVDMGLREGTKLAKELGLELANLEHLEGR